MCKFKEPFPLSVAANQNWHFNKEVLYLRWNEDPKKLFFESLIAQLVKLMVSITSSAFFWDYSKKIITCFSGFHEWKKGKSSPSLPKVCYTHPVLMQPGIIGSYLKNRKYINHVILPLSSVGVGIFPTGTSN